jgi:hypothetical protein
LVELSLNLQPVVVVGAGLLGGIAFRIGHAVVEKALVNLVFGRK